jgi:parallel beta-helix repeat protein
VGYTITGIACFGDASTAPDPVVAVSYNTGNYLQPTTTGSDEKVMEFCGGATATIDHNTSTNCVTGIAVYGANNFTITNNTLSPLTGAGDYGIVLDEIAASSSIIGNSVTNFNIGIFVGDGSSNNTFTGNTITNNDIGVQVDEYAGGTVPAGLVFHNNNFSGNTTKGFDNKETTSVNATNNWWGCAAGPGNTGCDSVSANVDFTPWLTVAP